MHKEQWLVFRHAIRSLVSSLSVVFLLNFFSVTIFANASADTSTLLIDKLRRVYTNLAPEDSSREAVALRLADLLAERGRVLSNEEIGRGCSPCKAGEQERREAIEIYEGVLSQLKGEATDRVQFQVGYLYSVIGSTADARKSFKAVLDRGTTRRWVAEAQLSMADMDFQERNFESAGRYYDMVLRDESHPQRGFAYYRKAWCEYQIGRVESAISVLEKILADPKLLSRNADSAVVSVDGQFQEEVSRDYASFVPKGTFSFAQVEKLFKLSPEAIRVSNVTYLAKELERLGQPRQALQVWNWILPKQKDASARLEGQIHLAELHRSLNEEKQASESMALVLKSWRGIGCSKEKCADNYESIRRIVSAWYNAGKAKPSPELMSTFENYLKVFPEDFDRTLAAIYLAKTEKQAERGMSWALAAAGFQADSEKKEQLMAEYLALAELSSTPEMRRQAYEVYLKTLPTGKKAFEVRYQLARLKYDKGNYEEAAQDFKVIALSPGQEQLRVQALNLSLDALALLKRENQLADWVGEYKSAFPKEAGNLDRVLLKTRLNQSAAVLNSGSADARGAVTSDEDAKKALELLKGVSVGQASEEDKLVYYKNLLIAAERAKDQVTAQRAVDYLLGSKNLKSEDRSFVLSRSAWLAELKLDFKGAIDAIVKAGAIPPGKEEQKKYFLRLALLSELAGQDPSAHYRKVMALSEDKEERGAIQSKLIALAKDPKKELISAKKFLDETPSLATEVALDLFAKQPDFKFAKQILSQPKLAETASGKALRRQVKMEELRALEEKFGKEPFASKNQAQLAKSIKQRVKSLTDIEAFLKEANDLQDWALQVGAVTLYERACRRFYSEVISLPIPAELTPEQQNEYLNQLSQMVGPYQQRAEEAKQKLSELWNDPNFYAAWAKGIKESPKRFWELAEKETQFLASFAPDTRKEEVKTNLVVARGKGEFVADLKELEQRRQAVRESPFDQSRISALLELEQKAGHQPMVAYLKTRLEQGISNANSNAKEGARTGRDAASLNEKGEKL